MKAKLTRLVAAGALSSVIVIFSGCASTEELAEVRRIAEEAQSTADRAAATASDAQASATQAQQAAADASFKADEAAACCAANSERMERMFQRSMSK